MVNNAHVYICAGKGNSRKNVGLEVFRVRDATPDRTGLSLIMCSLFYAKYANVGNLSTKNALYWTVGELLVKGEPTLIFDHLYSIMAEFVLSRVTLELQCLLYISILNDNTVITDN